MDLQLTIALIVVVLASCYLARRAFNLWNSKKKNCSDGGCGCSGTTASSQGKDKTVSISLEKLAFRLPDQKKG